MKEPVWRLAHKQPDLHYFITGVIGDAEEHIDLIDALYQATPETTIFIHLNTPGGSLDTAFQILNAMKGSNANVVAIADGQVASAGTLILFSAPGIVIQPHCYAMFHDGSEWLTGKVNENLRQAKFSSKMIKELCEGIYYPFLTKKEIKALLAGKDFWLSSKQLTKRVERASKHQGE